MRVHGVVVREIPLFCTRCLLKNYKDCLFDTDLSITIVFQKIGGPRSIWPIMAKNISAFTFITVV